MSMLLRAAPLRAVARPALRQQVRFAHAELNVEGRTIPINTHRKWVLGTALTLYLVVGMGLPWFAVDFHQRKAAGDS